MLLGLWGPFAIGKTTFLNAFMCNRAGNPAYSNTVFVYADLSLEYRMDKKFQWREKAARGSHWNGKQADKAPFIADMIADDNTMWMVESARYFTGMYECLVTEHELSDGGLRFVIPITDAATMEAFLRARCESRNKTFREDYWEAQKLVYEADGRYTNAAKNWFRPAGIPYEVVSIYEDRKQFTTVAGILNTWLQVPSDKWYGDVVKSTKFWSTPPAKPVVHPQPVAQPEPVAHDNRRRGRH